MDNIIIIYLEAILRLFKNSKIKEESLEGLIMQLSLLEKVKEILNNTIIKLKLHIEKYVKNHETNN